MELSPKFTKSLRKEDVNKKWWVVDASGMTVGRLSTEVAVLLRGKHKPEFTPHVDCGDFVIVINASKIVMQGKRTDRKAYFRNTGYPGGGRFDLFKDVVVSKPDFVVRHAVKGMLPKNRLGRKIIKNLKVFAGNEHPHSAQMPEVFELIYAQKN